MSAPAAIPALDVLRAPADAEALADVRAAARTHLVPLVEEGPAGRVNRSLVQGLATCGFLGRIFPGRTGGTGPDEGVSAHELCLLREAIAAECPPAETALAVQGLGGYPILQAGRPEQVERWIPALAHGRAVAAFALTEPGAGSDAAALALRAEPAGRGWQLTGEKIWISNAPDADVYTVFARTTPDAGARGVTAFVVPRTSPGLTGEPLAMVAAHAIGRLTFDGVEVGEDQVLGEVDGGFRVAMGTLDRFRPSVGAAAVGMGQAALEAACAHADARESFGQPIREFQAVSHALAEMATKLEAARLLVYRAAAVQDAGAVRPTLSAAMAKLYATEVAQQVIDAAIQVHGAAGLEAGNLLAELYTEVRALRIYEGTSEIQRTIIARELYRPDQRR